MWDSILKIGVWIIGAFMKRQAEKDEARKFFVQMVNALQKQGLYSVQLGDEFEEQLKRIRMEEAKEKPQA